MTSDPATAKQTAQMVQPNQIIKMPNGRLYRVIESDQSHIEYLSVKGNEISQRIVTHAAFKKMTEGGHVQGN